MEKNVKKISGRNLIIDKADKMNWLVMQEWFATKPFYELLSLDDILEYYNEFNQGGAYVAKVEYEKNKSYPVSLLSWKGSKETEHPIIIKNVSKMAYISDSMTLPSYRRRGIQTELLYFALNKMKEKGYESVYLRTVEDSEMNTLAQKSGMKLCKDQNNDTVLQITKTPRSFEYIEEMKKPNREKLYNLLIKLITEYDNEKIDLNVEADKEGLLYLLNILNELEINTQDKTFQKKFGKNIEETVDQVMIPEVRCFYEGNIDKMIETLNEVIASYNIKR